MQMRMAKWAVAISAVVTAATAVHAGERYGRWEKLGSREVRFSHDRDVVPVGRYEGDFGKMMIKVERNGIFLNSLSVIYSNGGYDRIPVAGWIPRGGSSRVIDLRGGQRHINRVDLFYRSVPNDRRKAKVEVWARH